MAASRSRTMPERDFTRAATRPSRAGVRSPPVESDGLPDLRWINSQPILDVAKRAEFEITPEGHPICLHAYADTDGRSPIIKLSSDNRAYCEYCRVGPMSAIDMLRHASGFDSALDAVRVFGLHKWAPTIAKGSHLNNPEGRETPRACEDPLSLLVLSGVWADQPATVQRLIPVLLAMGKKESDDPEPVIQLSYRAMTRYSGVISPNEISEALDALAAMGWLERLGHEYRGNSPIRKAARYKLMPLSYKVRELADLTAPQFGKKIDREKRARLRATQERVNLFKSAKSKGDLNVFSLRSE